jgi:hypothetical protein
VDNEDKRISVMELNLEQLDAWGEESSLDTLVKIRLIVGQSKATMDDSNNAGWKVERKEQSQPREMLLLLLLETIES